jgi:hypothetical protein
VIDAGGLGATIWHVTGADGALVPAPFVADTRYMNVPDVFPDTVYDVFGPV